VYDYKREFNTIQNATVVQIILVTPALTNTRSLVLSSFALLCNVF